MVNNFLGNPHKPEYEDIDEDFNVFDEEFLDDQDSSDYEDEDDDYYEEEEEDDNYDEDDEDDDDDDTENYWDLGFLEYSDIDSDVPGPPDGAHEEASNEDAQRVESMISNDKEPTESKVLSEDRPTIHKNMGNNSET